MTGDTSEPNGNGRVLADSPPTSTTGRHAHGDNAIASSSKLPAPSDDTPALPHPQASPLRAAHLRLDTPALTPTAGPSAMPENQTPVTAPMAPNWGGNASSSRASSSTKSEAQRRKTKLTSVIELTPLSPEVRAQYTLFQPSEAREETVAEVDHAESSGAESSLAVRKNRRQGKETGAVGILLKRKAALVAAGALAPATPLSEELVGSRSSVQMISPPPTAQSRGKKRRKGQSEDEEGTPYQEEEDPDEDEVMEDVGDEDEGEEDDAILSSDEGGEDKPTPKVFLRLDINRKKVVRGSSEDIDPTCSEEEPISNRMGTKRKRPTRQAPAAAASSSRGGRLQRNAIRGAAPVRQGRPSKLARGDDGQDETADESEGEDELDRMSLSDSEDSEPLKRGSEAGGRGRGRGRGRGGAGARGRGRGRGGAAKAGRGKRVLSDGDVEEKPVEQDDEPFLYHHRGLCDKCGREPADEILESYQKSKAKAKRGGRKKRKASDDDDMLSDDELAARLEGWLVCTNCVVVSHWGCLHPSQRKAILTEMREKDKAREAEGGTPVKKLRQSVPIDVEADFTCAKCTAGWPCFVCKEEGVEVGKVEREGVDADGAAGEKGKAVDNENKMEVDGPAAPFLSAPNALASAIKPINIDDESSPSIVAISPPNAAEQMDVDHIAPLPSGTDGPADKMDVDEPSTPKPGSPASVAESDEQEILLFRCLRCKQAAHYEHLRAPPSLGPSPTAARVARYYQYPSEEGPAWNCHLCHDWPWAVDIIIAWRPTPSDPKEPPLAPGDTAKHTDNLPREYLVKWVDRGFRHVTWVPHAWLATTTSQKLARFLLKGALLDLVTNDTLAARGDDMEKPTIASVLGEDADEGDDWYRGQTGPGAGKGAPGEETGWVGGGPPPDPEAEAGLPTAWSTADRVLDIYLIPPTKPNKAKATVNQLRKQRVLFVSASPSENDTAAPGPLSPMEELRKKHGLKDGIQPPEHMRVELDEWERLAKRQLEEEDVDEVAGLVSWCLVKWDDLQYDQSSWDTPPPSNSPLYPDFKIALKNFLKARRVHVPVLTPEQAKDRDLDPERVFVPPAEQPDCLVGGNLMPFQIQGFQWLLYKYFKRESCILADDMGLGKTVQIASVLGYLGSAEHKIYPCLVVVPNSTIVNWVREFEKWVPHMRVVPFYGEASSRKVISKYELYHKGMQGKAAGLKAHVVLTTYDMITGSEFKVFAGIPRWEVLCIDEGQRLKSDESLIFKKLKGLNCAQRILLTGTPLNNNLRELFNLLNFLDPVNFKDLVDLETRFDATKLKEGVVLQELHEMIKPYILRRIKDNVLKLPPKVEIIVPITLTTLQKQMYKGVIEKNADVIQSIIQQRQRRAKAIDKAREAAVEQEKKDAGVANGGQVAEAGAEGGLSAQEKGKGKENGVAEAEGAGGAQGQGAGDGAGGTQGQGAGDGAVASAPPAPEAPNGAVVEGQEPTQPQQ
ncbi:hypothetical protein IAT38_005170 [Cryptococcus sp. DSM 104549]